VLRGGGRLVVLVVGMSLGVLAFIAPCVALVRVPVWLAAGLLGRSVECEVLGEVSNPAVAVALPLVQFLAAEMRVWWVCRNGIVRV